MKNVVEGIAFATLVVTAVVVALLLVMAPQPSSAAMADAFVYRVENPTKITALQIALCNKFKYPSHVRDEDHVGQVDENGDIYPEVPNPEECGNFANRQLISWLDELIRHDTSEQMLVEIESNVDNITGNVMDMLGDSEIVNQSATATTTE